MRRHYKTNDATSPATESRYRTTLELTLPGDRRLRLVRHKEHDHLFIMPAREAGQSMAERLWTERQVRLRCRLRGWRCDEVYS